MHGSLDLLNLIFQTIYVNIMKCPQLTVTLINSTLNLQHHPCVWMRVNENVFIIFHGWKRCQSVKYFRMHKILTLKVFLLLSRNSSTNSKSHLTLFPKGNMQNPGFVFAIYIIRKYKSYFRIFQKGMVLDY